MIRFLKLTVLALVATTLPAGGKYDDFRSKSFVVENLTDQKIKFVVIQCDKNGKELKSFHEWVPAKGGAGFNLNNGDLHDEANKKRGDTGILAVQLDDVKGHPRTYAVAMHDMFGNEPKANIYAPAHFIIYKDFTVDRFQCKDARGDWNTVKSRRR